MIVKCQQQERKVSSWNRQTDTSSDDTPSDVPPAPLLLYRSSSMLVFKPAPFKPKSGEEVSYACKLLIEWFCSECSNTNAKNITLAIVSRVTMLWPIAKDTQDQMTQSKLATRVDAMM